MKREINLMLARQGLKKEVRSFFLISVVIFIIAFSLSIGSVLFNFVLQSQLQTKQNDIDAVTAQIASLAQKKQQISAANEREKSVTTLLATRKDITVKLKWLLANTPDDLGFSNVEVTSEKISLSFQSNNLATINTFLDTLYNLDKKTAQIKKADLLSFGRSSTSGDYQVQLGFELTK